MQTIRKELIRLARENPSIRSIVIPMTRQAAKWETLPRGWDQSSLEQFWDSLTGEVKHRVTKCIKEIGSNVDDPGAFCASLADKLDPGWRARTANRKVFSAAQEKDFLQSHFRNSGVDEDRLRSPRFPIDLIQSIMEAIVRYNDDCKIIPFHGDSYNVHFEWECHTTPNSIAKNIVDDTRMKYYIRDPHKFATAASVLLQKNYSLIEKLMMSKYHIVETVVDKESDPEGFKSEYLEAIDKNAPKIRYEVLEDSEGANDFSLENGDYVSGSLKLNFRPDKYVISYEVVCDVEFTYNPDLEDPDPGPDPYDYY